MRLREIDTLKRILILFIAASAVVPLFFIQPEEPALRLTVYKLLAKTGSLTGTILILWQVLLGFRGAVSRVLSDLPWVVSVHKKLGTYGTLLILLHPIFITLYYAGKYGTNLLEISPSRPFDRYVVLGILALLVLAALALTSVPFRARFSFRAWRGIHLSSYLMPPVVLIHSYAIGQTIANTGLRSLWIGLIAFFAAVYLYRLLYSLGAFSRHYEVVRNDTVAERTSELTLRPIGPGLHPELGQFVYLSLGVFRTVHPFTVTRFDGRTGELSITVKELGETSGRLQSIGPGTRFLVDGSYGVFGKKIVEEMRPVVMIAGGIGITAFRRLIRGLEKQRSRESYLFYGNEYESDIAFRREIDALRHVKAVHVLGKDDPMPGGESGFITIDLIEKHLERGLAAYDYLLCGPPVMIDKLKDALAAEGVPVDRIRFELFSF